MKRSTVAFLTVAVVAVWDYRKNRYERPAVIEGLLFQKFFACFDGRTAGFVPVAVKYPAG